MEKNRLKILIIGISTAFILTGCFGSDSDSSGVPGGFHEYKTDEISIQIPDTWEVIPPDQFLSGVPAGTLVAFRNNVRDAVYTPTVVIVKNNLNSEVSSMDFAKTLTEKTKSDLNSVQEVRRETVEINVGSKATETLFSHLEGNTTPDSETQTWMQISAVEGKTAFVALGSMLQDADEATKETVERMVRSFAIR